MVNTIRQLFIGGLRVGALTALLHSPAAFAQSGLLSWDTEENTVAQPSDFIASNNYNIRSADGERLCTVKKGTSLEAVRLNSDADFALVKVRVPGCPSNGWISVNGLQSTRQTDPGMQVDVDGSLALRATPAGRYQCGLPPQTSVTILENRSGDDQFRMWVKVRVANPPSGCPEEGWVHSEYLRPENSLLASLPRDSKPYGTPDDSDSATEAAAVPECTHCVNNQILQLKDVVSGERRLSDISTWKKSRGLVQIPTRGSLGNVAPCGSFHYSPDRIGSQLVDNYANPLTACVMMSAMQDWKKSCPDTQDGCRISWGDISHKTKAKFSGHKTHTDGYCMDIRPMRRGAFANAPLTYGSGAYDRATTAKFIQLLRAKGASTVIFNDPRIAASRAGGHDNHIHVCFKPNRTTRAVCENYRYDANICGGT
jgi:hypothetical protein